MSDFLNIFSAFVFQINLVNGYNYLDNKGRILSTVFPNDRFVADNQALVITDAKGEFTINSKSIIYKINKKIINDYDGNIYNCICTINENFIKKSTEVCKIIDVQLINRIACRFIVEFPNLEKEIIRNIFKQEILDSEITAFEQRFTKKGLIAQYKLAGRNLTIDIDKFINRDNHNLNKLQEYFMKILGQFKLKFSSPVDLVI